LQNWEISSYCAMWEIWFSRKGY